MPHNPNTFPNKLFVENSFGGFDPFETEEEEVVLYHEPDYETSFDGDEPDDDDDEYDDIDDEDDDDWDLD